jgi:hypothetical protein
VTHHDIQLHYISTILQVVDIFTKCHIASQFHYLHLKLKVAHQYVRGGVKLTKNTRLFEKTQDSPSLSQASLRSNIN